MTIVGRRQGARARRGSRVGARARRRRACARRRRRGEAAARRRSSTLADRVRRWHAVQRPAGRRRSRSSRASCSSGAGCRSTRSASTCRATSSRRSSCAPCPRRWRACGASSSARRRRARASIAAAAELLGLDEVWALGGPQAIGFLAYVERVDKIVGPGNPYVNDAKLEVSRDVPIDLPGGPSEVVVLGDGDPRLVELELAAQREHGHEAVCSDGRDARGGGGDRARAPRAARRGGGATPTQVRNAGSVFVGPWSPVAGGRLRDRRQPRAADERLGALGRRPRPRDVPEAGDRAAPDRGRASRASARRSRRSPRPRACPRTPRRCGDESARAGVRAVRVGAADRRGRAARRDRPVAGAALRPEHAAAAAAVDAARRDRRRARARQRLPGRRLPRAAPRDRRLRRRRARRTSCSARAPTT